MHLKLRLVANSVALFTLAQAQQDVCRALVLSGGGALGAWEAGILHGIANNTE